ncbi:SUKH-3 domain-containing protein [Dactylosporangium sp. NPDC048998]|uniref:SUKH-3 domain-containing protein n=1 Tax=Dactylosporangium sp. NPDC048998 TaxID=3363976 RepID=UPI00371B6BD9
MTDPVVDEYGRPGDWHLTDTPRQVRLPPVPEPGEMDGFRLARVFQTPGEDCQPRLDPARGRLTDDAQRRKVLEFLESGTVILDTGTRSTDLLEPTRRLAVPGVFRTDGRWIWDGSVAFYLRWHLVPPEPDFLAHITARGYRPEPVDETVVAAARQALDKADATYIALRDRWKIEHGLLADPGRFPLEFQRRLFDLGWRPGRDVSAEIDPWLEQSVHDLRRFRFPEHGYFEYEPFDAARKVFHEFGGLRSLDNSGGVTSARVPFVIFPRPGDWHTLTTGAVTAVEVAGSVGRRVFQIGYIEDGSAILVIAEDGSVHLAGAVEKFVGATFDQALMALMNGDLPQEDPYAEPDWA